jgi:fibronectin-binding autotransporter adhesin
MRLLITVIGGLNPNSKVSNPRVFRLRHRQVRGSVSCLAAALLLALVMPLVNPANATTYTWDGNGTNTGNGKWTTVGNWDANGLPVSNLSTTDLVFGGTFHLTPLQDIAPFSAHSVTFNSTAGSFNLSPNASETLTIGTGGITNNSSNAETITSALILGGIQSWNTSAGSLAINGTVNLGGFALSVGGSSNTTISSAVSSSPAGSNSITKNGSGILTLSGAAANTYSGLTTVNAGELDLAKTGTANAIAGGGLAISGGTVKYTAASSDMIANTANVTIGGGTLDLNNHADTIGSLTFNSGTLTSTGGTQTLALAGSTATTLQMRNVTIPSSVNLAFSSATTTGVGMTFDATNDGTATISGNINLNSTLTTGITRTFTINNGTAATDTTITGAITNTTDTGLTKVGTGTLLFSGATANTYSGLTTVSSGELDLGKTANVNAIGSGGLTINAGTVKYTGTSTDQIANTAAVTVSGGTLDVVGNSDTVGAVTLTSGNINGTTGTLTGSSYGVQSGSISAKLGGTGVSLTKSTAGTVILTGANSYTGGTNINAGTLALNSNNVLPDAGTVVLGGGKLQLNGVQEGTTATAGAGPLSLTSNSIIDLASTDLIHFLASNGQNWGSNTLSIYNWNGTPITGGGAEQILFGSDTTSLTQGQLGLITFYSDAGTTSLGTAMFATSGDGEIVPLAIPEPGTWLASSLVAATLLFTQRRRLCSRKLLEFARLVKRA